MSHYNTIMQQLLTLVPRHHFDKQVEALDADRYEGLRPVCRSDDGVQALKVAA